MKKFFVILLCLLLAAPMLGIAADEAAKAVVLNINTLIYHAPHCTWARRCTKNCIKTTLENARENGARACKVCGGGR